MTYRIVANYVPSGRLGIIEEWDDDRIAQRRTRRLNKAIQKKYRDMGEASPITYRIIWQGPAWNGWLSDPLLVKRAREIAQYRIAATRFGNDMQTVADQVSAAFARLTLPANRA